MPDVKNIVDVTEENFMQLIVEESAIRLVVVDFWAPWCQPCRTLLPLMEKLAGEYAGSFLLAKVNIDENQGLAMQFGVRSVPTVKLVFQGRLVDEFTGALPEGQIREILSRHIEPVDGQVGAADDQGAVALANEAAEAGDEAGAIAILRAAHADEPDEQEYTIELARRLVQAGEVDEAEQLLGELPIDSALNGQVEVIRSSLQLARALKDAPALVELERRVVADPMDYEAGYYLAMRIAVTGNYEDALEQLLQLMRRDRSWGEEAARKAMVAIFNLLDGQGPLVARYRRQMFTLMH
jgi:putative thioredoxin